MLVERPRRRYTHALVIRTQAHKLPCDLMLGYQPFGLWCLRVFGSDVFHLLLVHDVGMIRRSPFRHQLVGSQWVNSWLIQFAAVDVTGWR